MSMSSAWSATIFLSLEFSLSSSFRRFASSPFMPPYWLRQRCQVDSEISSRHPPRSPGSSPPMKVSSTSTVPASRSPPGRTSTDRSRCSMAHAVWYEPMSSLRWRLRAEMPSLSQLLLEALDGEEVPELAGLRKLPAVVGRADRSTAWPVRPLEVGPDLLTDDG